MSYKKIICVDFDGVLHSYKSGWQGISTIPDEPVPGAIEWLNKMIATEEFDVAIYSSRSKETEGIVAMKKWLSLNGLTLESLGELSFPTQKPPAFLTIDDRAMCFTGIFPGVEQISSFKPWNKI